MLEEMVISAKKSAKYLAQSSTEKKNRILKSISKKLWEQRDDIFSSNKRDIVQVDADSISESFFDRMTLNEKRLKSIIADLDNVISLEDPVGEKYDQIILENGLKIYKQRVPLGLLAVIYESRPNVTIDISGLAIKTGNGVILRGGKETINTNSFLVKIIKESLAENNLPESIVQFIDNPDRTLVNDLLKMDNYIDMLIPRGNEALHRFCVENSYIPVITGGIGICHLYVDSEVNMEDALSVIKNSKIQKPSVCNALDTVLVNKDISSTFIPKLIDDQIKEQVQIKIHENVAGSLSDDYLNKVDIAGADDFDKEWLSLVLGIKIVDNIDEAIDHITVHGTAHSDGILTNNNANASKFLSEVDSAAVYVNASTRFTDGGQFGLGAEVAVSTQKLHARGPMGLKELTSYKWIVEGDYQVRD